jgi:ribosomal-protein-alanine N-acetyltransferase
MASSNAAAPQAILKLKKSIIRPYELSDVNSLVLVANNPNVAHNLRHRFPSPYTTADAISWIESTKTKVPLTSFVLIHPFTGAAMGSISLDLGNDVHCRTAELGYWLGEPYWGQGIMSEVVGPFLNWAFANVRINDVEGIHMGLTRIFATVYDRNKASENVVQRAGMIFEGKSRASVWKNGLIMDQLVYSMTLEDWEEKASET